jgi:hypothetical protein
MKTINLHNNQQSIKNSNMSSVFSSESIALAVLLIFLLASLSSYAQNQPSTVKENEEQYMDNHPRIKTPMKISGIKTEVKGNHEVYINAEQGNYIFVYNKRNTLMHTYSSYLETMRYGNKYISFDKTLLDSYIEKILSPHFGGKSTTFTKDIYMSVSLFADIDGNIKEIGIDYPKELKIPSYVIEKFEKTVLKGELKLIFDKNLTFFRDATWVSIPTYYKAEKLRKQGLEKQ